MIGPTAWSTDTSAFIVPVAVDPEFAVGVNPGVRVAFTRKADKSAVWAGISKCGSTPKKEPPTSESIGYLVVSKSDGDDKRKAVLAVRVEQRETNSIIDLSDGVWHPVVVATDRHQTTCIRDGK
jgi:hypothetical protein